MTSLRLFFLACALVPITPACKNHDATTGASGAPAAKPVEPGASTGGTVVTFKKFATDLMTADDLAPLYPEGKHFTLSAVLKSPADCTQSSECRVELSDGANTYKLVDLDLSNKAKLDGKAAGAAITLDCAPVYEQGSYDPKPELVFDKSCTVK